MGKKKIKKTYIEIINLTLLTLAFILINVLVHSLVKFNLAMYKGVFAAFQYGVCLIMVICYKKKGSIIAVVLMNLVLIEVVVNVIKGDKPSIPGLFNVLFYLTTLIIIAHHNFKRELDNKTDMITGCYNGKGLRNELKDRIAKGKDFSIIYLSLGNFKDINDGFGHAYGDELLRKIVKRINMRLGSDCVVARLGGSEFVVLEKENENVKNIADRLLNSISEKSILVVDNTSVDCYATCYAGISSYPKDAADYESLLKHADIAMSTAMADKSKEAYFFDESMLESMNRQRHVEKMIKDSLEKKLFYLVYQPQYEVQKKKLRGFETLIRMRTESGEFISPAEFIPIAEKNDLILQIDDYVLLGAMVEFKDLVEKNPDLIISINVSAKNFASENFVEKLNRLINDAKFPSKNLEIEITEYCMVDSFDMALETISKLKEMDIQIALDDFGTGYTSLDYVSRLPINLLKIDKSLIDDIENDKKRRDFVHAVINMGQLMGCEVISEGVENESQVSYLKEYDCNLIQGFIWGKPLIFNDAKALVD
ncbi:MAG: bifunctional diguanylate cyclase/phosphodiesterase [Treponema sp.]|nr:bifunctional diguanylate cyclase/phosphodiesterase [Treponema sp.]